MQFLPDGNTGSLVVSKVLSFNLNFSFLSHNLLISSSYPSLLMSLSGPVANPRSELPEKFLGYGQKSNLGPLGYHECDRSTPVVIILATGSEVRRFKLSRGQWIFSELKILSITSFGREIKAVGPVS